MKPHPLRLHAAHPKRAQTKPRTLCQCAAHPPLIFSGENPAVHVTHDLKALGELLLTILAGGSNVLSNLTPTFSVLHFDSELW